MVKVEIRWVGFLSNCDDTILKFDFGSGYKVKTTDLNSGISMISELYEESQNESANLLMRNLADSITSKIIYYLEKISIVDVTNNNFHDELQPEVFSLAVEAQNVLVEKIRKMRLIVPGNIMMPLHYTKCYAPIPLLPGMGFQGGGDVIQELWHVEEGKIHELYESLSKIQLPFNDKILQVSFDLFELSYTTGNPILSYLSCMMAIESLLNPDRFEVRNRVSRNLAVLIGNDKEEVDALYKQMLDLYDKRSGITHGRTTKSVNQSDVINVRNLLRRAILEYHHAGMKKEKLLLILNKMGFDSAKSWAQNK